MLIYYILFYLFCSLSLFSALLVVFVKNPVFASFFLILCFCNIVSLLFFLRLDFIPITFLVVYVGAIAVLFLFVIMMLNIKLSELKHEKVNFMPLILMFCLIFGLELFFFLVCSFNPLTLNAAWYFYFLADFNALNLIDSDFINVLSSFNNMKLAGQLLFVDYYGYFIIVGFVLLLSMIAVIVLTLSKRFVVKSQAIYVQVLRSFNNSIIIHERR